MTALDDLIRAVEAADGPSREIDTAVAAHIFGAHVVETALDGFGEKPPPYTASIDAVVALIRREMPGAEEGYRRRGDAEFTAYVGDDESPTTKHRTPALALLLAFLRAARARQENDNG
jgi:hypothetical protein